MHYLPLLSDRIDPLAPTPNTHRNLMTTLYAPRNGACQKTTYLYMPPETTKAEETKLQGVGLNPPTISLLRQTNCTISPCSYTSCPSPERVLIFSPGFGITRHFYSSSLISIASKTNSLILALDHPFDADIVEYPPELKIPTAHGYNGTLGLGNGNFTFYSQCLDMRIEDENYAFEKLPEVLSSAGYTDSCVKNIKKLVREKGIGLFGHSLGGATAFAALNSNKAFKAGMDWDGSFITPLATNLTQTTKPFELVLATNHPFDSDTTYNSTWPLLKGYKKIVNVNETLHLSFSDGPAFVDVLRVRELGDKVVGEVGGAEMLGNLVRIVEVFFSRFV